MPKKKTFDEFVNDSIKVYGDVFEYPQKEYVNARTKMLVRCKICGYEFYRVPKDHLIKKYGCQYCNLLKLKPNNNTMLDDEEWKDIHEFEGLYKISNKGRLMSFGDSFWKILSNKNSKGKYLNVVLRRKDGFRKSVKIHKLVYETFIGKNTSDKLMYIHHIDGNKQNNCVENLILVSPKEHSRIHSKTNAHFDSAKRKNKTRKEKYMISQLDMKGELIACYESAKEAERKTGVCSRNILQVANREPYNDKGSIRKQAGGYIWKFEEE